MDPILSFYDLCDLTLEMVFLGFYIIHTILDRSFLFFYFSFPSVCVCVSLISLPVLQVLSNGYINRPISFTRLSKHELFFMADVC